MKRTAIVLVVFLGLLVGADFAAAAFAEHTVSRKAAEQLGLRDDPAVTIHGFPFTTQALSGEYGRISLSAQGVPVQDLRDVSLDAELHDVTAPLSDLTAGDVSDVVADRLDGRVTLKDSDIARVAPLTNIDDLRIEPSSESYVRRGENGAGDSSGQGGQDGATDDGADAGDGDDSTAGVRLSGKADIAGERIEIFAFAMMELEGTTIRIDPHRIQFGNDRGTTVVPEAVQERLLPHFEADINAGQMPFTVTPTGISVASGSITLHGEAENVSFTG